MRQPKPRSDGEHRASFLLAKTNCRSEGSQSSSSPGHNKNRSEGQEPVQDCPGKPRKEKHDQAEPGGIGDRDMSRCPDGIGKQHGAKASNQSRPCNRRPQKVQRKQRSKKSS